MIATLRFPILWSDVGFPNHPRCGEVTLHEGDPGWGWEGALPDLPIAHCPADLRGEAVDGWWVDHVVVITGALDDTVDRLRIAGAELRRRGEARGRPAAFLRAGPVIEVVEFEHERTHLWGVALATTDDLTEVAVRWAAGGWAISEVRPAVQEGRHLFTVRGRNLAVFDHR